VALDGDIIVLTFRPSTPCRIIRFGWIAGVELTGTATGELQLVTHELDGTPAAALQVGGTELAGVAQEVGGVQFCDLIEEVVVKPGDFCVIDLNTSYSTGDGFPFIHYQALNWDLNGPNSEYSDAGNINRMLDGSTAY
jgi:hypothetical protein